MSLGYANKATQATLRWSDFMLKRLSSYGLYTYYASLYGLELLIWLGEVRIFTYYLFLAMPFYYSLGFLSKRWRGTQLHGVYQHLFSSTRYIRFLRNSK